MTICLLCNKKVENTYKGFMEHKNNKYHFVCVKKYGYNKFCLGILNKNT